RKFDNRLAGWDGPHVGEHIRIRHHPTLCDVRPAIGAVGGEQRRGLAHLRVGIFAEEPCTHHASLREMYRTFLDMMTAGSAPANVLRRGRVPGPRSGPVVRYARPSTGP